MIKCVAIWCSAMKCGAVWCSVLQCVAVCCSVLQCVAVCCSVLQFECFLLFLHIYELHFFFPPTQDKWNDDVHVRVCVCVCVCVIVNALRNINI